MRIAAVCVLALAISARATPLSMLTLSAQGAKSVLAAIHPMANARINDVTSQFFSAVPHLPKTKARSMSLLHEHDPECTVHSNCTAGEQYCDSDYACDTCFFCPLFNNAVDEQCPECGADPQVTCLLQNGGPCLQGVATFAGIFNAETAAAATTSIEGFCGGSCTDVVTGFQDAFNVCNINSTGAEAAVLLLMAEVLDAACADTECAGAVLWSFGEFEERQDTFCDNSDCGIDIFEPLVRVQSGGSEADANCAMGLLELTCLEDASSGNYCMEELAAFGGEGRDEGDISIAPFCGSTCAASLTSAFSELEDCGVLEGIGPDCELDFEFQLLDLCTVNDEGDYCLEIFSAPENCADELYPVPAPAMEETNVTQMCSAECTQGLNTFVGEVGCCAAWGLNFMCAPDEMRDLIEDACGVMIGDTCDRPVLQADPEQIDAAAKAAIAAVAGIVTLVVFAMVL